MKIKQLNKILFAIAILTITTPAQANEIAGTRVEGQGALCGQGQGKSVEINTALKKEFSYCFALPTSTPTPSPTPTPTPSPTPTPTPSPTPTPTSSENTNTNTQSSNPVLPENVVAISDSATATSIVTPTPTPTPTPTENAAPEKLDLPERSYHVEVNATTQEVIIREETIEEWLNRIFAVWTNWFDNFMYFWGWTL